MTEPRPRPSRVTPLTMADTGERVWVFFCPGCGGVHMYDAKRWAFNENLRNPTFSPSYLCGHKPDVGNRCHSYVTDGRIQFLGDCGHALRGQTVELPELPVEWLEVTP